MSTSSTDETTTTRRRSPLRALGRGSLDIQSTLLVMLLAVSFLAAIVIGAVGYVNGRDSLRAAAFDQVTSIRESRARDVERTLAGVQQAVVLDSRNDSALSASAEFNAGFAALDAQPVDDARRQAVVDYYADTFVPRLDEATGSQTDPSLLEPTSAAQTYLQSLYTVPFDDDFDASLALDTADDGSAWSQARAAHHDYFREMVDQLGYEDVLLLDLDGNVVYSAYSGVDLGTNVEDGPYSRTALADVWATALESNTVDSSFTTDFQPYAPSLGVPTAWIASPVGSGADVTGVLAVQVPTDTIDSVMTGDEGWADQGLGSTGEAYLAGPDETMRSTSRELIQRPEDFADDAVAQGTSTDVVERQVATGSSVLLQPVATTAVEAALQGRTGTTVNRDYLGNEVLAAYAPIDVDGLDWVIVAKVDTSEAFAPVDVFTRNLLLSTAAIILVVSLLSLLLAQVFVRPVRRLQGAVNRVSGGEIGVEVPVRGHDEFSELGTAFNDMSRSLKVKQDLIDEQRRENDRLLLTLMPEALAKRYKEGEETIAEDHTDVAVVYADVVGFDDFSRGLRTGETLALLDGLWRSFDEAAERLGVEKVRSSQRGYLASCGLAVPRIDNARRVVDFTLELQSIIERFNATNGSRVALRAGLDTGEVTSGLVGRTSMVYDMWGDAVTLAHRVQDVSSQAGIYATERVVQKIGDAVPATDSGTVTTQTGEQRVYRLERPAA
ncbi:adenylate/guanylate cyclase domain-containing protein [Frigoribacterium faeni]|uniref:adenylate/guanylate cyclase domain-containing protein n=1 Tax=Frigoribacterium faeni TaxID=145483 RepID=UPI00141BE48E|nr:class 3 adenylate cyclase [Frigoribacterium faeni]